MFYVADGNNGAIRKVTQAGVVTTIAGPGTNQGTLYYGVEQVAVSSSDLLYILDAYNCTIWTVNTNGGSRADFAGAGTIKTYPANAGTNDGTGNKARFDFPESMWFGPTGDLFVCNYQSSTIRKVTPQQVVTTIGGQPNVIGSQDGTNSQALFNLPEGIFVDPWGNVYVADTQSSTIRIGYAGPPTIVTSPQNLTVAAGASPAFTVTAGGGAPRSAYQWKFNGTPLTNNAQISGAQSNILTLTSVALTNAGTYQVVVTNAAGLTNASATLTVSRTMPLVTWTNPAAIVYGTALSSNQLNATANVPGAFAYTPTTNIVLTAGTNTLLVVFTPTDTNDYTLATNSASLVVSPAALTVSASNASRAYGQTNPVFTGTVVGVTNGDNITAAYNTAATSNSPAGTYPIVPSLVDPSDRETNYTVTLVNGTLTVFTAPVIQSAQQSGGLLTFTWTTLTNQMYQIQSTAGLTPPNWTNLGGSITATNSTMTMAEPIAGDAQHYYRIVLLP